MKITALLLSVFFLPATHAGTVRAGDRVDLVCVYQGGNTKANSVELTVKEKGAIERKDIPSVVPGVFMDDLEEGQFLLREFAVKGTIRLSEGKTVHFDTSLDTSFYGGLSYPDIGDGFTDTNAYGSYADDAYFRAFTIEQQKLNGPLEFGLYWSKGFATTAPLDCSGTIPTSDIARPGVVKEERYDRHFKCEMAAAKDIPAATFEMKVANLQNVRLMEAVEFKNSGRKSGWFVHGEDMDKHILGKLNDADSQILVKVAKAGKARLVSKYFDECGESDCFSVELDLPFPAREDKKIEGTFRYREGKKLKARPKVTCDLK